MDDFVKSALQAYEKKLEAEAQAVAERHAQETMLTHHRFLKLLEDHGLAEDGEPAVDFQVDGITVCVDNPEGPQTVLRRVGALTPRPTTGWQLRGACPICDQLTWSTTLYQLADIGAQVAEFEPGSHHITECRAGNPYQCEGCKRFLAADEGQRKHGYLLCAECAQLPFAWDSE